MDLGIDYTRLSNLAFLFRGLTGNSLTGLSTTLLGRTASTALGSALAVLGHLTAASAASLSFVLNLVLAQLVVRGRCLERVGL